MGTENEFEYGVKNMGTTRINGTIVNFFGSYSILVFLLIYDRISKRERVQFLVLHKTNKRLGSCFKLTYKGNDRILQ